MPNDTRWCNGTTVTLLEDSMCATWTMYVRWPRSWVQATYTCNQAVTRLVHAPAVVWGNDAAALHAAIRHGGELSACVVTCTRVQYACK